MLQAFVMVGSVILVAVLGVIKVGGVTEVLDRAVEGGRIFSPKFVFQLMQCKQPPTTKKECFNFSFPVFPGKMLCQCLSYSPNLTTRITFWNSIASLFFMWTCHITFSQNCVQRLISLPSLNKAKR